VAYEEYEKRVTTRKTSTLSDHDATGKVRSGLVKDGDTEARCRRGIKLTF
jgi:hypothetical protein